MNARVKTARRRGYTKVSAKNQVTIPQDALLRAGLKVGDRLRAEAGRPGELILVREEIGRSICRRPDGRLRSRSP